MLQHKLITDFTEHYMEKLFYFCLKRTGNKEEAENLTQDIALQIITALCNNTIPTNFSAWVWQIARNRYSNWAEKKHKHSETFSSSDICDYELADQSSPVLDEMIHSEQLALLRRELAFISTDYQDIVIAYYIHNQSIRDIAKALSLTTDAVKKTTSARQNHIERRYEYDKRIWNKKHVELPENICISKDGCGNGKCNFVQYRYSDYSLWNRCIKPSTVVTILLWNCTRHV